MMLIAPLAATRRDIDTTLSFRFSPLMRHRQLYFARFFFFFFFRYDIFSNIDARMPRLLSITPCTFS